MHTKAVLNGSSAEKRLSNGIMHTKVVICNGAYKKITTVGVHKLIEIVAIVVMCNTEYILQWWLQKVANCNSANKISQLQ